MTQRIWNLGAAVLLFLCVYTTTYAQSLPSSELYHELLKLKETKRVLYVAAHPDDENTRLIAYMSNAVHAQVAYLSLTRGDGGQNLIGPQLGIGLGQIRTQELLKARETDGGRQFFTRAADFGYSKNPDETLKNWEKSEILADVTWVIRQFKPDILITRFNTIPGITHGHHTTSAILAGEAFNLAADPNAYPEQLEYVDTWQPKRIFWNSYNFRQRFQPDPDEQYQIFPVGDFNPLLGETYSQIASDSRTMHKSQGFGSTPSIGKAQDYIQFLDGEPFESSAFEGVENRWNTIPGGDQIEQEIESLIESYNFQAPSKNVDQLLKIRALIGTVNNPEKWLSEKHGHIDRLILDHMGAEMELNARQELVSPGDKIAFDFVINNTLDKVISNISLDLLGVEFKPDNTETSNNSAVRNTLNVEIPSDYALSQPYWLEKPIDEATYQVDDQLMIGKPFNDPNISGKVSFEIDGQSFEMGVPLMYKYNDRVDGEIQQPVTVIPSIDLEISSQNLFITPSKEANLSILVNFHGEMLDGELSFDGLNEGQFDVVSERVITDQNQKEYQITFDFESIESKKVKAQYITSAAGTFDLAMERIIYKHIPNLTYFKPAEVNLIKADWKLSPEKIGYIEGAGDDVPGVLESLGYDVVMLSTADLTQDNLSQYKAVVVGIRAYNTNQGLVENQDALMEYVKSGGTVVTQYNTSGGLLTREMGPYAFALSRTRVTVQGSPVEADWSHPVFSFPNQLNQDDFDNWVQERGLYFVTDIDSNYDTPLTLNEPGEDPTKGSLIYTKYGEGTFIYSGISFFRQLPAGVPGATKLFVNMIEQ